MNKFANLLLLSVIVLVSFACSTQGGKQELKSWMAPSGKVKALSTIGMIDDLVKQVGGENVETLTLVKGELNPHAYQLVKGDDEKLAAADLIFYNGLGLEHGPSLRHFLEKSPKSVGLGDLIKKENPSLILHCNGIPDPHIWMDMALWVKNIKFIVDALSKRDPEHAAAYRNNGARLQKELLEIHQKLKNEIGKVPPEKRFLITSHDAFNYFARSYLAADGEEAKGEWEKRFAAPEGLAPESQLCTTDIRKILDHLKKYNIHVIFPESNVSQASIRKLLSAGKEEGINIRISPEYLYGDAMGAPGSSGDTYEKMMEYNIRTLAKYLSENDGTSNK